MFAYFSDLTEVREMKRLSKLCKGLSSSSKHSYESVDEDISTQKLKFASLYEEDDAEEEAGEDEDEVLRQKNKKIRRTPSIKNGVNIQHQQEQKQEKFVCSKCGKGFQSLKAKCGHMACHSEKVLRSNLVARQKLAMDDSQSDTESGAKRLMRRTRYKKHNCVAVVGSKAKVDVYKGCSTENSGVEQEQEEVAISLMMLSRDLTNWGGVNSVGDSSDNNSVVLEARSISAKLDVQQDGLSSGDRVDAGKKVAALEDSESALLRSHRKNKFNDELNTEPHLSLKKLKRVMDVGLIRDGEGYNQTARPNMDLYLKKIAVNESYITGYNAGNQYSISEMYQRFGHKELVHSQPYQTFSAMAENHRIYTVASPYESGENSFETDGSLDNHKGKGILEHRLTNVRDKSRNGKHECPICFKIFKSGQALGGHRRVHIAEGYDEVAANFKQSGTQSHNFIDLNLPAPMENDEASC